MGTMGSLFESCNTVESSYNVIPLSLSRLPRDVSAPSTCDYVCRLIDVLDMTKSSGSSRFELSIREFCSSLFEIYLRRWRFIYGSVT